MKKQTDRMFREDSELLLDDGFHIEFVTMHHNSPPHWHRAMELQFILNGSATVRMDGRSYKQRALEFILIDSAKVHDVVYALPQTMGITIHISKNFMRRYLPDMELLEFRCNPESLTEQQQKPYSELCEFMKKLTIHYFNQQPSYALKSNALVLDLLAVLVDHFSTSAAETMSVSSYSRLSRMEQIYQFVEENHAGEITLQDGADTLGLNKEYFCRMFRSNMGISFITYVNQVRMNHIYQDLIQTDDSVLEITERHGFFNQKLFYRMFKKRYDCTPLKVRQIAKESPYSSYN